uniref:Uncharacterized protein n=1 Tax=Haematobia irritans TaxID=7368 RepID=A0A1L8E7Y4_HAEIR
MSTPRKDRNFSYNSPYSKPMQQLYASQCEEFISLEMGGRSRSRHTSVHANTNDKRNSSFGSHQKTHPPKNYGDAHRNRPIDTISSYVHPSMTEDPWHQLTKRIESIAKSRISLESELNFVAMDESKPISV